MAEAIGVGYDVRKFSISFAVLVDNMSITFCKIVDLYNLQTISSLCNLITVQEFGVFRSKF